MTRLADPGPRLAPRRLACGAALLAALACGDGGAPGEDGGGGGEPPPGTSFASYLGGIADEMVRDVAVDAQGFVYVAGRAGAGFPVTAGALQTAFGGGVDNAPYGTQDGFLCKLAPDGRSVVFCTYFGNADNVPIRDLALGPGGDIWIVTSDDLGDFPSTWFANTAQPTIRGGRDALVARISADGSRVVWATYLGGSADEGNTNTIRVDRQGNAYVAMFTHSPDAPTPNGFDGSLSGPSDTYVAKLSADGSTLLYATYVGGSGGEDTETHQLAVDSSGNAFVAIPSTSTDFPTTAGAYQRTLRGPSDALVVKIGTAGQLLAATYLGGSGADGAEGVAVDAQGNVYLSGFTRSADFPGTIAGGGGSGDDVYLAALSPSLDALVLGARVGGSGDDRGRSVIADGRGGVVAVGQTTSPNFPVRNALRSALAGPDDGVVVRLQR
ncbi:MAG TPA: SBBP repeat-containing protein [Gemmatimonadales bacterium]|nr:SBBP repeat-containing protein [Gemmatimonadales bacterium]